ncbi:tetracycline efflux MFS transporter Tcr3 [Streptomyces viridifaciens]|uniref:tetracycline efflux MFS transporter Tcr3 n=1 Tax=Kitasatospora aureofaciens TaxID=1894 RepID=UPI0004C1CFC6|nr:tetracycline efflux MFS transporter Tcr3 [Streptomyces viridifaciens]UKZ08341.1 tetracycline efflux MFS transporter Tcr3 [Streptomyces viridifaciens]
MANATSQTGEAVADEAGGPAGFTHRQIITALSGLLLAVLLAALDQTIVSTALRTIGDQLHGQTVQAWVITGYLVSSTIAMPFYGKLSDIYGRKPLYLAAIAVFIVGSAACAMANSMETLAIARVLQGFGGAGLMSLPTAVIADLAPVRERGRYFSYLMMAWVAASVLGPLVGGLFAGAGEILGVTGWRWAFLINVPLGLVALLSVRKALNLPHRRVDHPIDFRGALTLALCLVPLLIVAEEGLDWGWGSARSLTLFAVSLIGLVLFVLAERARGLEAMVPLRLFRRGGITMATAVNFTIGVGIFGTVSTLPLFLQLVQGRSATVAGLVIIPVMTGAIVSQTICAKIIKKWNRYKKPAIVGLGSMAGALLSLSAAGADTPLAVIVVIAAWLGFGIGLSQTVITLAIQSSAPKSELGVANAASGLFRQLGGTSGAAVFMSVLFGVAAGRLDGADPDEAVRRALSDPDSTGGLSASAVDAFTSGFDTMFLVGGLILAVGFLLTFPLRELRDEE